VEKSKLKNERGNANREKPYRRAQSGQVARVKGRPDPFIFEL
jgi:hypothetical protein